MIKLFFFFFFFFNVVDGSQYFSVKSRLLKELRHDIFELFFGTLKIVVNWRETLNNSLPG